ncbi:MAG: rhodanese-like domain-containing protein [Actinomycetota bacterium]|nr:rhodanese-like domain-containing protein [Actinomycetota bacterium]
MEEANEANEADEADEADERKGGDRMPISVDRDEVQRLLDEGAILVEVLEAAQYRAAHLPGAIHIPAWELSEERAASLEKDRPVILYCFDTL